MYSFVVSWLMAGCVLMMCSLREVLFERCSWGGDPCQFICLLRVCLPSLQMALYILSSLVSVQCCAVSDAHWVSALDRWSSSAQWPAVDCMHSSIWFGLLALFCIPLYLQGLTQPACDSLSEVVLALALG